MNETGPRFSIVIPCFNQGAFIGECLASLAAQTLAPHQIIVVDDGSPDPYTSARLAELCVPPIELIRQKNGGPAAARNAGVARATGDWILPLDADDALTPDALATYAAAIASEPGVDVWYPDVQHFGTDQSRWEAPPFSRWRLLSTNMMVSSLAIRRAVFDAGVRYNERLRQGFEDWELTVHALCERGFTARALEATVFKYRRWGYGRLATSLRAYEEAYQDMCGDRPIYRDAERILAFKREASPFFAIAARGSALGDALGGQEFRDYRVVDETDRVHRDGDLGAFRDHPGRMLFISIDDALLTAALGADRYLLEKVARIMLAHEPRVLWLVAAEDPECAYPGLGIAAPGPGKLLPGVCIAAILPIEDQLGHPKILRTDAGMLADLAEYGGDKAYYVHAGVVASGPGFTIAGKPKGGVSVRWLAAGVGHRLSMMTRGAIGPKRHDRVWRSKLLLGLKDRLQPPEPTDLSRLRGGPLAAGLSQRQIAERNTLCTDAPTFTRIASVDSPGLLIVAPWMVHGGADRAIINFLEGVAKVSPERRRFLVTTLSERMQWARQVLPLVDGFFSLPDLAGKEMSEGLADLVERLNIDSVLLVNSLAGLRALPALRKRRPSIRVVNQQHCFDPDPVTGKPSGYPILAPSGYDNLIDLYAPSCAQLGREMVELCYVSPSKIKPVRLGIDIDCIAASRRPRLKNGGPARVLWLGRLVDQKNPQVALAVAREWKRRHGANRLHFVIGGDGPLAEEVRLQVKAQQLSETVTLLGAVDDPLPLYRDADILMMTSRYEGIPLLIVEAMVAGIPIVTPTRDTAIEEVLSADEASFISESTDPAEYVRALEALLADPAGANRRADRVAERSNRLSREHYARELLGLL